MNDKQSSLIFFHHFKSDRPIYLAIKGLVYDVSASAGMKRMRLIFLLNEKILRTKKRQPSQNCIDFYGKRGAYNIFAGKDCTRAIAKWSKNKEDMTANLVKSSFFKLCYQVDASATLIVFTST